MDAHDEEIVKGSGLPPDPYAIEIASDILGNLSANQAEEDLLEATSHFTNVLKQKGVSTATLMVAVRCRPLTKGERANGQRTITRLVDGKIVVVMDPDDDGTTTALSRRKDVAAGVKNKEKKYVFDVAFDGESDNESVYRSTVQTLIPGVLRGLNATVFAYGATGSGKTYTMVGTPTDPGLMVLSLQDVFTHIARERDSWEITCSYVEVYNEVIYDLLTPTSVACELREDPEQGPVIQGVQRIPVHSADKIFMLLKEGNMRRKTEATDANDQSSRSHAVLEIVVTRTDLNHYNRLVQSAKLALVDLAGSERASETNNVGRQLKDGANINRSLLALANCINALGKRKKKGLVFVPFRNSKLTRLLKDGLCGNSRTLMIANVSSASGQYYHTISTLKYANRAKEIKTHVRKNEMSVQAHIAEYQRVIDALREENTDLATEIKVLKRRGPEEPGEAHLSAAQLRWARDQAKAIAHNTRQRKAEQHALLEVTDAILRCTQELREVDAEIAAAQEPHVREGLAGKRELAAKGLAEAERVRRQLQQEIQRLDRALSTAEEQINRLGSTDEREALRLQIIAASAEVLQGYLGACLQLCSHVVAEQDHVIRSLWRAAEAAGMPRPQLLEASQIAGLADPSALHLALAPPPHPASPTGTAAGALPATPLRTPSKIDVTAALAGSPGAPSVLAPAVAAVLARAALPGMDVSGEALPVDGGRLDAYLTGRHTLARWQSLYKTFEAAALELGAPSASAIDRVAQDLAARSSASASQPQAQPPRGNNAVNAAAIAALRRSKEMAPGGLPGNRDASPSPRSSPPPPRGHDSDRLPNLNSHQRGMVRAGIRSLAAAPATAPAEGMLLPDIGGRAGGGASSLAGLKKSLESAGRSRTPRVPPPKSGASTAAASRLTSAVRRVSLDEAPTPMRQSLSVPRSSVEPKLRADPYLGHDSVRPSNIPIPARGVSATPGRLPPRVDSLLIGGGTPTKVPRPAIGSAVDRPRLAEMTFANAPDPQVARNDRLNMLKMRVASRKSMGMVDSAPLMPSEGTDHPSGPTSVPENKGMLLNRLKSISVSKRISLIGNE